MKFTLNIDDALLGRVMETTGAKTKTEAIHAALSEIDRRHKLIALLAEGLNITDWDNAIDVSSWGDVPSSRVAETPPESPKSHDRKSRSRR